MSVARDTGISISELKLLTQKEFTEFEQSPSLMEIQLGKLMSLIFNVNRSEQTPAKTFEEFIIRNFGIKKGEEIKPTYGGY